MNDPASVFRALHHGRPPGDPLVLPGPWDAASARVFEEAGFPALATPSAGVAASLGYADGDTPADEMFAAVARIARAVSVPVSADVEAGYGLAPGELVDRLLEAGVVGCNLEDSTDGVLVDPHRQADRLAEVRAAAGGRLFVNARVDTYIHGATRTPSTSPRTRWPAPCSTSRPVPTASIRSAPRRTPCPAWRSRYRGPAQRGRHPRRPLRRPPTG